METMQNMAVARFQTLLHDGLVIAVLLLSFLLVTSPAFSSSEAELQLQQTVKELEQKLDARIGIMVSDGQSDWRWGHRENERFLMNSTFKSLLCATVLDRVDQGQLSLEETIKIRKDAILDYAPVTEKRIGQTLSVGDLCLATLDLSDNTAANLLIERLGGPQAVTDYLRSIGDDVTRLDRMEPELNNFNADDPRDTTSPEAMVSSWKKVLTGDALSSNSRNILKDWMSHGAVTGKFFRAFLPGDWKISDKSGGGRKYTRSLVAMITPSNGGAYFVAIFVSDTPASWSDRNAAVLKLSKTIFDVISAKEQVR
ncbi:MAG: class A beta-lactamase [Pseudomonadota bacterium]